MEQDSWQAALHSDQKLALQTGGPVHNVATMPGFRFQPTEEELVGFYLRGMVMGNRLEVDLINVLNLYRYDPWELPAMSFMQSEREWLFFCPRDKKYPNGARPNRVTASGYWKATGTDRPVRRAQDARCIGLKKTLVFYTGKAPRGRKTEWIMNEYRLPRNEPSSTFCQTLRSLQAKKNNNLDLREVALCRIYKKPFQINLIGATANLFADHLLPDIVDPVGSNSTVYETSSSPKLASSILETEIVSGVTSSSTSSACKTNIVEDLKGLSSSFMRSKYPGVPVPARVDLSAHLMARDGLRNSGSLFTVPSIGDLALMQHDRNAGAERTVNRLNWSDSFPEVSVNPQHSSSRLIPTMASAERLLKVSTWSPLQPLSLDYPGALMKLDFGYGTSDLDKIGYLPSATVPQSVNSHFEWNSLPL